MAAGDIQGARYIAELLKAEGATTWFGLPGSQFLPILDLIHTDPGYRFVTTRHEQGAAYMAYGYARATLGLGVCFATVGPGAANLLAGIAAAHKGRVPVLAYTAKQSARYHGRDMFQEYDQVALYAPVTKLSAMPTSPAQLATYLRGALRAALTPPYGPVHLDVMPELLAAEVAGGAESAVVRGTTLAMTASRDAVEAGARRLREAARPVIVAGDGVGWGEAGGYLRRVAERLGAPVLTAYHALDAFPASHPLALGPYGPCGRPAANAVIRQADLILDVGGGLDFYSTRFDDAFVPSDARIVQVTDAPERVGAAFPVDSALVGPLRQALAYLEHHLGAPMERAAWRQEVAARRAEQAAAREAALAAPGRPGAIQPEFLMATLNDALDPADVVVSDSGNAAVFLRSQLDRERPNTFVDTTNFSAVGSGLPVAIGVRAGLLARPRRDAAGALSADAAGPGAGPRVVCVTGDGGFMLNLPELETAVRENLPVVVVVANDFGYGNVRSYQRAVYGDRRIASDLSNPDFARLAREFGAEGWRVERPEELEPALAAALGCGRTAVVDVLVDADVLCTPLHAAR